ncbi:MAG: PQQ-binding-like beta-propeller repeat protein [Phycisphaerae bacterium]|nr:PQQ-binding-like beta-propeller repeat protein [Phycisphaerae bacterium]
MKQIASLLSAMFTLVLSLTPVAATDAPGAKARSILGAAGVKGGLVVHLGCGNGKLTAALHAGDAFLVHGLDADAANVDAARRHIRSLGLYGKVSAARLSGKALPYADDLVNLVVAEDLGKVPMAEVTRVLAPNGVAYVKAGGGWKKTVKPQPTDIDDWSHFLHDASNNAVASDTRIGPPKRLRWTCGPLWSRSHEYTSSLAAMVSAGGRVFYIFDYGKTGITDGPMPGQWKLTARDAFNGMLLWEQPIPNWGPDAWRNKSLRGIPPTVPRRIVAEGDRVMVTLGYAAPVSILDAATGKAVATCEATGGAQELRVCDGVLLVRKGTDGIIAFDAKTARKLWEKTDALSALSLAAQDGRVFYQVGKAVTCLDLKTGKELWKTQAPEPAKTPAVTPRKPGAKKPRRPRRSPSSLVLACGDRVLFDGPGGLQAIAVKTGKTLWTLKGKRLGGEPFVAQGKIWQRSGRGLSSIDLATGRPADPVSAADVFTWGHHPRCYQSKATKKYVITPNRGVEFVSLTGEKNSQHDWTRGACKYGIMPGNGLLYVPPDPCFCFPGVKITGFQALAARDTTSRETASGLRLEKGLAFGTENPQSAIHNPQSTDWPTYRYNTQRSGATACEVPSKLAAKWTVDLKGPPSPDGSVVASKLTPPVAAGGRVYVAARDEHTLYALKAGDGQRVWQFTAGGRIDSPPTIHGEQVLFGSADGHVYCLRASDGELAWRFRAAPADGLIVAFGQLESPWRVHGSVLVVDGVAYCTAGRSTYLDGGIHAFALDPATGKVVHQTRLDTWAYTRKDAKGKPFIPGYHIEGALSDVLVSEGGYIYMGQYKLDRALKQQDVPYALIDPKKPSTAMGMDELMDKPYAQKVESQRRDEKVQREWQLRVWPKQAAEHKDKYGASNLGERTMGRHVLATGGFLDDSWYNRTFWMYSPTWPGFHIANRAAKTGQLLVVGPRRTYAVQAFPYRNLQSPLFTPGSKGYLLFADANDNEPVIPDYTRGVPKGIGFTRKNPPAWFQWVPLRIRAMTLAGTLDKRLVVAGPPDVLDPKDPMGAFEGRKGGLLRVYAAEGGKMLTEQKLTAPPVLDGMIAAGGRIYMTLTDGKVVCMGGP